MDERRWWQKSTRMGLSDVVVNRFCIALFSTLEQTLLLSNVILNQGLYIAL